MCGWQKIGVLGAISLSLVGCGVLGQKVAEHGQPELGGSQSATLSHALNVVGAALVLNYVYQPLEPNWEIADVALSNDTHRISMRMKRFITGGEGEAWMVAKRYAERLKAAKGASGYAYLEFSQGVDSGTPFARRVAEGVVRFTDVPPEPGSKGVVTDSGSTKG